MKAPSAPINLAKGLASKLHPPMPISSQETGRLLTLLNKSFQQQLDSRHPINLRNHEHHTDLHLRSILTNPLLSRKRSLPIRMSLIQELLERPIDAFTEQVAAGSATLEMATLSLQSLYNECLTSQKTDLKAALRASKAGTTMREWLWSSGLEESGNFFAHPAFVGLLIRFLVAESQYQRLRLWLQMVQTSAYKSPVPTNYQIYRQFLQRYISSEVTLGRGLVSAMAVYNDLAEGTRNERSQPRIFSYVLYPNACYLMTKLVRTRSVAQPHDPIIKSFLHAVMTSCESGCYLDALHDVYLEENPKIVPALKYFDGLVDEDLTRISPAERSAQVQLGLRTTEMCLERGSQAAAISVMKILQTKFADELGFTAAVDQKTPQKDSKSVEEESLHLLDALAMA